MNSIYSGIPHQFSEKRIIITIISFQRGSLTDGLLQAQKHGEVRLVTLEDLYR